MAQPQVTDRTQETTVSAGLGDFTLAGAVRGSRTLNDAVGVGPSFYYEIRFRRGIDVLPLQGQWERGLGHLSAATTFVRDVVHSNSLGSTAKIDFDYGVKEVEILETADARKIFAAPDFPNILAAVFAYLGASMHWKLNEASGNATDSIGSNTLTDNNTVTSAAGKIGNARQFTAANSESLTIADNAVLSGGNIDFTIAGWVYLDSKSVDRVFCAKGSSGNYEYVIRYNAAFDTFQAFFYHDGTNSSSVSATSLGTIATGTWYFVVVWHDSVSDTINIQVNNGTVDSAAANAAGIFNGTGTFALGKQGSDNVDFWDGRIDSVTVWRRALSPAERAALYNGGSGVDYPF